MLYFGSYVIFMETLLEVFYYNRYNNYIVARLPDESKIEENLPPQSTKLELRNQIGQFVPFDPDLDWLVVDIKYRT
jgi:hypothetical protein